MKPQKMPKTRLTGDFSKFLHKNEIHVEPNTFAFSCVYKYH